MNPLTLEWKDTFKWVELFLFSLFHQALGDFQQ